MDTRQINFVNGMRYNEFFFQHLVNYWTVTQMNLKKINDQKKTFYRKFILYVYDPLTRTHNLIHIKNIVGL